jgi:hypothetical protein
VVQINQPKLDKLKQLWYRSETTKPQTTHTPANINSLPICVSASRRNMTSAVELRRHVRVVESRGRSITIPRWIAQRYEVNASVGLSGWLAGT